MMLLHPTLLLPVLIGCSLASFISPQYVNSYGYGNYPTQNGPGSNGQNSDGSGNGIDPVNINNGHQVPEVKIGEGNGGRIIGKVHYLGPNGKLVITNCNVCRLCCIGRNVTYEVENINEPPTGSVDQNGYPIPPYGFYQVSPSTPSPPGKETTTIITPTTSNTPGSSPPGPYQPSEPTTQPPQPNSPSTLYPWPQYPYPTAPNQYGTAPPSYSTPYPCVPYPPTTDGPTTTTARPPCVYGETTPFVPTYPPTEVPITTTTTQPTWPTETPEVTTTTPGRPDLTPGPNGECCYIDLRSIQATVSCGVVGTKSGCCSKTCSQSSQVQRQIQINFQLLSRYFGQIPPRITCSEAVRFGLVQLSEITGVCTPKYTPYPIPTGKPNEKTTVIPPEGEITIPTNGPNDVYATTPSSASVTFGASILSIFLATVLCL